MIQNPKTNSLDVKMNSISQDVFDDNQTVDQFGVSQVAFHTHNGSDSPKIMFRDISDASSYRVVRRINLSSAQILALNTTPITLVPALGNGVLTIVEGISASIIYGGTAYTGANALEFRYTDASGAKVTADIPSTFINSTANAVSYAPAVTATFTPIANSPIVVRVPTADPATGNSYITFTVTYRTIFT